MKLFILRHAKTERNSDSGEDFDRDLKNKGYRQMKLMRNFFKSNFDQHRFNVYCSTAVRTRSTFEELKPIIRINEVYFHDELYLPSQQGLLNFLWNQTDESEDILLIGHNNGLSDLCSYISGEDVLLPTCGLIVYDFPDFSNINEISKETGIEKYRFFPDA